MVNLYGADILDPVFIHCMIMMMMTSALESPVQGTTIGPTQSISMNNKSI